MTAVKTGSVSREPTGRAFFRKKALPCNAFPTDGRQDRPVCRWRRHDGRQIVCCNLLNLLQYARITSPAALPYAEVPQNLIDPYETSFGILQHFSEKNMLDTRVDKQASSFSCLWMRIVVNPTAGRLLIHSRVQLVRFFLRCSLAKTANVSDNSNNFFLTIFLLLFKQTTFTEAMTIT